MDHLIKTDFIFVGPPKTGTTWIYDFFSSNSKICLSNQTKELEYFNKNFHRGSQWYNSSFPHKNRLICDISTSYFISDIARYRIRNLNPNTKIIITIRNPAKRLISHFKHNIKLGIIKKTNILEALGKYPVLIENSLYSRYINHWLNDFGSNNVLILPIEILERSPELYVSILGKFMDIQLTIDPGSSLNKSNYASQPKNYYIAKKARQLRKNLNNLGQNNLVRILKKMGFKKLIMEGGKDIEIEGKIKEELRQFFREECINLRKFNIEKDILDKFYNPE